MRIVAGVLLAIVIIIAVNAVLQTKQQETATSKTKSKLSVIPGGISLGGGRSSGAQMIQ